MFHVKHIELKRKSNLKSNYTSNKIINNNHLIFNIIHNHYINILNNKKYYSKNLYVIYNQKLLIILY